MELSIRKIAKTTLVSILTPDLEVDHNNAAQLKDILMPLAAHTGKDKGPLVLDMSNVKYLASAGVRVFVLLQKDVSKAGGELALTNLQPVVREVLVIGQLIGKLLAVFATNDDALAQLDPEAVTAFKG